jgi:putative transposase
MKNAHTASGAVRGRGKHRHRRLVDRKWTYPNKTGRLPVSAEAAALIKQLATENSGRGDKSIQCDKVSCASSATGSAHRRSGQSSRR